MLKPKKVPDRGHGYQIIARTHDKEWDVEGPGLCLLKHNDHYDIVVFGSAEDEVEQLATLFATVVRHPRYQEIALRAVELVSEMLTEGDHTS